MRSIGIDQDYLLRAHRSLERRRVGLVSINGWFRNPQNTDLLPGSKIITDVAKIDILQSRRRTWTNRDVFKVARVDIRNSAAGEKIAIGVHGKDAPRVTAVIVRPKHPG